MLPIIISHIPPTRGHNQSIAARSQGGKDDYNQWETVQKLQPLLTIFTTFKNMPDRISIHTNTIKNWALFLPYIQPVLLISESSPLNNIAKQYGWKVLNISETNEFGTPRLKNMYEDVMNATHHNSLFYGFCNGDILFDEGLLDTLMAVQFYLPLLTTPMMVGRRTNVNMSIVHKPDDLCQWEDVRQTEGQLFIDDAEDYFIIANAHEFIWDKLENVVIGRVGYDNYLVAMALRYNVSVVDVTETVKAVHQTGADGDFAGQTNVDSQYNIDLIGPFDYDPGRTTHAQYLTINEEGQGIQIYKRPPATYFTKILILIFITMILILSQFRAYFFRHRRAS